MLRGEARTQTDRTAREQNILHRWEQRLGLRLPATCPTGNEQMHRYLVEVLGQIDRRIHVAPFHVRITRMRRCGLGRPDVAHERGSILLCDERPPLRVGDRNEKPRLTVAATGRESARLAHLANQRIRHRVGFDSSNTATGSDGIKQPDIIAKNRNFRFGQQRSPRTSQVTDLVTGHRKRQHYLG